MRRRMVALCVALLGLCGVLLSACSGGGASMQSVVADPADKFVGTWKLASIETQGITFVGDFSFVMSEGSAAKPEATEEAESEPDAVVFLMLQDDGTGTLSAPEGKASVTWELADDNTAVVTSQESTAAGDSDSSTSLLSAETLELAYVDDALVVNRETDDDAYTFTFTESGSIPDEPEIDLSKATEITALDGIVGTWRLTAMKMMGATMYGAPEDLAAMYGDETYATLEVGDDGSVRFMGQDVVVQTDTSGSKINLVFYELPVKMLDGQVVVDMTDVLGIDLAFCFAQ